MARPASFSSSFELFRRLARRQGVPARHADDVAQDALLRGLEAERRIEPGGDVAPYRVTIALNQARDHVRNARRRGEVLTSFDDREIRAEAPNPEELLRRRQREELMRRLIGQVDPKYRDILIKHDLEGIPLARIAAELGLETEAVKTQHRRAVERLKAAHRRWTAQQRARGWDEDACVVPFGPWRGRSWSGLLARLGLRILVQVALVIVIGALARGASAGLATRPRSAPVHARIAPPPLGGAAPARAGGASSAAAIAAPAGRGAAPSTPRGDARAPATLESGPAKPAATVLRGTVPERAARPAAGERETTLIREARSALDARDAIADLEARRLLEAHAREFPRGRLAAEREALLRQLR